MRKLLYLAAAVLMTLAPFSQAQVGPPPTDATYVIPINGMIERGLLYAFRRAMHEAKANGAGAIVLDIDTPGGKLGAAEEIILLLLDSDIPTYTYVNPRAISAGAMISLATDTIYMHPNGLIGDAMPIMMSPIPGGGAQEVPEGIREKVMSPTIALVRSAAQAKGHDSALGEAMVRPEFEYKIGERVICPEGQLLTLTATDATEAVREDGSPLLAAGTAESLADMLAAIGRADQPVVTISITAAERLARLIEGFPLSSILLALGLLGLYIEFKTPGFGVPGVLGMLFLAIWFWGHHIAGLAGMTEVVIFLLGTILLLLEIFVIPGFGAAGIAGIACMVIAIIMAMVRHYPTPNLPVPIPMVTFKVEMLQMAAITLGLTLFIVCILGWLLAKVLPHSGLFNYIALQTAVSNTEGYTAPSTADDTLVGMQGTAGTPLHPAGIGVFDGKRRDVVTRGEFIEKGKPIVVAVAHGNRIVVRAVDEATADITTKG